MKRPLKYIDKLLQQAGKGRLVLALGVLSMGTTLLLLSIMIWANVTELLAGKQHESEGQSSYVVIGKSITERNMASANFFEASEVKDILKAPQVQDVGEIMPARFPVYATIGGKLAMTTDLPVASVPNRFIDHLPDKWKWQPGDRNLPVILSAQFLDIYNYVFAPGQRLPQLSRSSVKAVALRLQAGGERGLVLSGYVAGFSERLNTLIVPQEFIEYGNATYAAGEGNAPSQLILKVKDPSDKSFVTYLDQHGYTTDPQSLRWSRIRTIAETVASVIGVLALIIMGMSAMTLTLFTELTIARSEYSLTLLRELGYSVAELRGMVIKRFVPVAAGAMVAALLLCSAVQIGLSVWVKDGGLQLPMLLTWHTWAAFAVCVLVLWIVVERAVKNALHG